MTNKRKTYTKEFRLEAVRLLESSGRPAVEVAREPGIKHNQLYKWRNELNSKGNSAFKDPGRRPTDQDDKVAHLERENARYKEELEILKKAAAYFVREIKCSTPLSRQTTSSIQYSACVKCSAFRQAAIMTGVAAQQASANETTVCYCIRYALSTSKPEALRFSVSTKELLDDGVCMAKGRVERLMRINNIQANQSRRHRRIYEQPEPVIVANILLNRGFSAKQPNRKWVSDITSLPTRQGYLYLAIVLDLYSRTKVGWSMRARINGQLVLDTLVMAIEERGKPRNVSAHSDQAHRRRLSANAVRTRCSVQ